MDCNEYREKFVHEEMSQKEREEFAEHIKRCSECRRFVEKYNDARDFIKFRTEYIPSRFLEEKIISKIKAKKSMRRLYEVAVPTVAVVIVGLFFVVKPLSGRQIMYEKVASTGIEMLSSNHATQTNTNSDLGYLVKIKYASDQF